MKHFAALSTVALSTAHAEGFCGGNNTRAENADNVGPTEFLGQQLPTLPTNMNEAAEYMGVTIGEDGLPTTTDEGHTTKKKVIDTALLMANGVVAASVAHAGPDFQNRQPNIPAAALSYWAGSAMLEKGGKTLGHGKALDHGVMMGTAVVAGNRNVQSRVQAGLRKVESTVVDLAAKVAHTFGYGENVEAAREQIQQKVQCFNEGMYRHSMTYCNKLKENTNECVKKLERQCVDAWCSCPIHAGGENNGNRRLNSGLLDRQAALEKEEEGAVPLTPEEVTELEQVLGIKDQVEARFASMKLVDRTQRTDPQGAPEVDSSDDDHARFQDAQADEDAQVE